MGDRRDNIVPLTLESGEKPRKTRRKSAISKEQAETFFETLAETCNVTHSCDAAGISTGSCYKRRRADAAFRQRWVEALAHGYAKLELALLERALVGTEKVTTYKDGKTSVVREYPNALAMSLLKMHRDTVREVESEEPDPHEVEEARERILMKLERMAARMKSDDADA
ncbi:hypothetical protein [Sphingomicrobium marinum]|uniref:hypothetical protein n=1 Tax=Sphingomicrobium marinum TaxID=1227950 RepID=UPI00224098D4|nr:hypothetical protein [Sphingomicrobium marinum]